MAHPAPSWLATAAVMGAAVAAAATPAGSSLPAPGSEAWEPLHFRRIDAHTHYEAARVDGRDALRAHSECSASALVLDLRERVDLQATPRLRWSWKLERGLDGPDEQTRAGDDFAARVYLMFEFDRSRASLWERARRRVGESLYGSAIPGHALNYVWSSREPVGSTWTNPYSDAAHMIVVRSGTADGWQRESVDVLADHERLVGEATTPLMALAVMSDSDDHCGQATAWFADFEFLPRE